MALIVQDHRKSFGDVHALRSLSFHLDSGKSVALLGPNGAGKSTAVKILVSLVKPDAGTYLWKDENLFAKPARIRDLVGYVSQELAMDKILTGAEFMRFCAGLLHLDWKVHRQRAHEILKLMGLEEAKTRKVGDYSGGMKRRLDLAAALLHDPKVLVLDEPTTGLDIEAKEQIWALVSNFVRNGGALILASHDFREVAELADEVLILQKGEVVRQGEPEALKQRLGAYIIRIKTHEFMHEPDMKAVREGLKTWGADA